MTTVVTILLAAGSAGRAWTADCQLVFVGICGICICVFVYLCVCVFVFVWGHNLLQQVRLVGPAAADCRLQLQESAGSHRLQRDSMSPSQLETLNALL